MGQSPRHFGEATRRRTDMERINTFKIALAVSILISLLTVQSAWSGNVSMQVFKSSKKFRIK